MSDAAIECRGLTAYHGATPGIVDLDLVVARGEVFGLLGPNGAGKTTTIRLLLDLLRPTRGAARVLGEDVRRPDGALRGRVGFLPGDLALFPRLSGARTLNLFSALQRRPPVRREDALDRLGFPREALRRPCRSYSTGMRQMIGLVIALQHDPELLILDEPTTALDPLVRDSVLDLVRDARSRGRTVFLSSHVLDEVERVADRVGLLAKARLRLVEPLADLRRRRPRRVEVTGKDGAMRAFEDARPASELLRELAALDLADVKIAPASLDSVFRSVVTEART